MKFRSPLYEVKIERHNRSIEKWIYEHVTPTNNGNDPSIKSRRTNHR